MMLRKKRMTWMMMAVWFSVLDVHATHLHSIEEQRLEYLPHGGGFAQEVYMRWG
jgi:hypothetical protein